jgi:hypothetical protein
MTSATQVHWLRRAARAARGSVYAMLMPIKAAMTSCTRTDKRRWRKVATEVPPWDERNRMIATLIPPNSAVVDLGCGAMTLKGRLAAGCIYQPCDVVQSAPEVLQCDFNAGLYPALTREYDFVICSGVLEYMRDPLGFLTRISRYGTTVLLSYNPMQSGESKMSRLAKGWLSHMTQPELEQLFRDAGLSYKVVLTRDVAEMTYELARINTTKAAPGGKGE